MEENQRRDRPALGEAAGGGVFRRATLGAWAVDGAAFAHAALTACCTARLVAWSRRMNVQPDLPHAPGAGKKTPG